MAVKDSTLGERRIEANLLDLSKGNFAKLQSSSWRDLALGAALCVAIYLVYGEYAQIVCNVCTTVPAAAFTFKQLSNRATRLFAYKATLFYWTIHGVLVAADNIFMDSDGYFFGKFLLLTILFMNAIYQHDVCLQRLQNSPKAEVPASNDASSISYASDSTLYTGLTVTDATQYTVKSSFIQSPVSVETTSGTSFCPRSAELTAFSDDDYTSTISLDTAAPISLTPISLASETAISYKSLRTARKEDGDSRFSSISRSEQMVTSASEVSKFEPSSVLEKAAEQNDAKGTYHTSPLAVSENGEEVQPELLLEPSESIIFTFPFLEEAVGLTVTNKIGSSVMWALKTNAYKRLVAEPTCGVLPSGASVQIRVGMNEEPPAGRVLKDRIAIDYSVVDNSITEFDRAFLRHEDPLRRRKELFVYYEREPSPDFVLQ